MSEISEQQHQNKKRLIEAEKLLFDTLREYGHHFWRYLLTAAVVMVPLSVFTAWFNPETRTWWLQFPFIIISTLITFYPHIALLHLTRELYTDTSARVQPAYLTAISLFFPFLLTMVLSYLALIFGIILCIIPGIIVYVWFCIADGIVVWEGKSGMAALLRSRDLTKPYFFRVLWILIFFDLTFGIGYLLISQIPAVFIPGVPSIFTKISNATPIATPWWYLLCQELLTVLFFPTNAIMTFILYRNLKETAEIQEPSLELPLNL